MCPISLVDLSPKRESCVKREFILPKARATPIHFKRYDVVSPKVEMKMKMNGNRRIEIGHGCSCVTYAATDYNVVVKTYMSLNILRESVWLSRLMFDMGLGPWTSSVVLMEKKSRPWFHATLQERCFRPNNRRPETGGDLSKSETHREKLVQMFIDASHKYHFGLSTNIAGELHPGNAFDKKDGTPTCVDFDPMSVGLYFTDESIEEMRLACLQWPTDVQDRYFRRFPESLD